MTDTAVLNLDAVIRERLEGFRLQVGYSLELVHGLMGYFPAVFANDHKKIVLVFDVALIKKVWGMLSPREARINRNLFYVNEAEAIALPILPGHSIDEALQATPMPMLTQTEFELCAAGGAVPFKWAPGLVGDDMSVEEFRETLRVALSKIDHEE